MTQEIVPIFELLARKLRSVRAGLRRHRAEFLFQREAKIRMQERHKERKRIARDLHDTLFQSFQALLLRLQAVSDSFDRADSKQRLDKAIDQAAQAIAEGRDVLQALRSSPVVEDDLALAVNSLGKELVAARAGQNCPVFHIEVKGAPRELHPLLRDEVYRIASEAIRNAFQHAQARQIETEILYHRREFRLHVRDNGKGIDPRDLENQRRSGHWGLEGMRERALRSGARLELWSRHGTGTEVTLQIPAAKAYKSRGRAK